MLDSTLFRPLGVDLFCLGKKFLVFNLITRNIKSKYHRSALGLLWTLLSPLANTVVFYFVFKVVLNIQIPHYIAFILSGMLPWAFFNQTIMEGMESVVGSQALLSKVPIPIQVFPFVASMTNLITLTLALPILIGAAALSGVTLSSSLILLPYYLFCLSLIAYGGSLILAILFTLFRDLRHIMTIAMQILFYSTPIIYQESMIPHKYAWVLYLNPLAFIFVDLHAILARGEWPELHSFGIVTAWTLATLSLAVFAYKTLGENLVERI